jgi:hypothetical protein
MDLPAKSIEDWFRKSWFIEMLYFLGLSQAFPLLETKLLISISLVIIENTVACYVDS